uniref:Uncharacterized protein n=1 Tax=Oryza nivara TaxID=4536 RepID=A0A0E0I794_ORYNI
MQSFMKFVDNLLLCRSPLPLDDLSISDTCNRSDDSIDYSDIHPWVRHALRSNARAFGIMEHSGTNLLSIDADDYEEYPNAAAAIDPPCKETEEIFLPKLKSSPFRFSMAVSKRFLLVPAINISGFANSRCIM